jgi:large subunit ribosomal protein L17
MKMLKLNRSRDNRKLLLRNLTTAVIVYESIITTPPRGKAVSSMVDRIMTIGLTDTPLVARRKLAAYLTDEQAVVKVLDELIKRYQGTSSGFTRRFALPPRKGDGAPQVVVQMTKTVLLDAKKDQKNTGKKEIETHTHETA